MHYSEICLGAAIAIYLLWHDFEKVKDSYEKLSTRNERIILGWLTVNCLMIIQMAYWAFRNSSYLIFIIMLIPNIIDFKSIVYISSIVNKKILNLKYRVYNVLLSICCSNFYRMFRNCAIRCVILIISIILFPTFMEINVIFFMIAVNTVVVAFILPLYLHIFKFDAISNSNLNQIESYLKRSWSFDLLNFGVSVFILYSTQITLLLNLIISLSLQKSYSSAFIYFKGKMENWLSSSQDSFKKLIIEQPTHLNNTDLNQPNLISVNTHKDLNSQSDEEIVDLLLNRSIPGHNLEKYIKDYDRCILIRRKYYSKIFKDSSIEDLSYQKFCYDKIYGQCCENVIGYVGLPVGLIGPLLLNGQVYYVPMATTEGCLVASTNRGSSCVRRCNNGIQGVIVNDGITRAPVLRTTSVCVSLNIKKWIENENNYERIKSAFDSTSKYARLKEIKPTIVGRFLFLRFKASTGEAMGMNMISKGVELALSMIQQEFGSLVEVLSISGNLCADKKASAINWIEGRGKSVVCEIDIPLEIVETVLKVSPSLLVETNIAKNLVGSAMAGTVGGFNAHAANIVTAIFAATGQDLAQVVESSHCLTFMEIRNGFLYVSCTMPCIEVGTVGGGTILPAQRACLNIMKLDRNNSISASANLALVICASVLCSELSLLAALCTGTLVKSHLVHNRSQINLLSHLDNN